MDEVLYQELIWNSLDLNLSATYPCYIETVMLSQRMPGYAIKIYPHCNIWDIYIYIIVNVW